MNVLAPLPPPSILEVVSKSARIMLIIGGVLAVLGPTIGLGMTVVSMVASFHQLGQNGIANPNQLAEKVGNTLIATSAGIMAFLLGACLLLAGGLLAYFERRHRPN